MRYRRFINLIYLVIFGFLFVPGIKAQNKTFVDLLPMPESIVFNNSSLKITPKTKIIVSGNDARFVGERLSELINSSNNFVIPVNYSETTGDYRLVLSDAHNKFDLLSPLNFDKEEYSLNANNKGVTICAGSRQGLLWGAMTLFQLIKKDGNDLIIPGVEIQDKPHYQLRGFMIDAARAPSSMAQLKRIIRICSVFKLNFLIFREGDDELNAVRYKNNPLGSENPYALTITELKELSEYAKKYGISVIPEIESLGHSTAKGLHYPNLVSGGFESDYEGIGTHIRKSHLNPKDPRTFELLEAIYSEWIKTVNPPMIHIGMDEVRMPEEEQAEYLHQLLEMIDRMQNKLNYNFVPMVWSDAAESPDGWKEKIVRCLWSYGRGNIDTTNHSMMEQRFPELIEDGCKQPVVMAGGSGSGGEPYTKESYHAAYINLAAYSKVGAEHPNFIGLMAVQWHGNMLDDWLPDFVCAADFGWTPAKGNIAFFNYHQRILNHLDVLVDFSNPNPNEVDPHAWNAIWVKDGKWVKDILKELKLK